MNLSEFLTITRSVAFLVISILYSGNIVRSSSKTYPRLELLNYLLESYPKYLRPVINDSTVTTVVHGMTMTHIVDVDERNQIVTAAVWVRQYWNDEYLTWNPEDFGGITEMRLPFDLLWQPDIVLYNSAEKEFFRLFESEAVVSNTGRIGAFTPDQIKFSCKINAVLFPFDSQSCELKYGSWSYNGFLVDLTNESASGDISQHISNGEWLLLDMPVERHEIYYPCCPEFFPDVTYTIYLQRKSLFYLVSVICPCIFISVLIVLGFCLPSDSGEKIMLEVTCILSLMVFLILVNGEMPPTSENVPLIQVFFIGTIGLNTLSCVFTSIILNIHYKGLGQSTVPGWLHFLVYKIFANVLCMNTNPINPPKKRKHDVSQTAKSSVYRIYNPKLQGDFNSSKFNGASRNLDETVTIKETMTLDETTRTDEMKSLVVSLVHQSNMLHRYFKIVVASIRKKNEKLLEEQEWKQIALIMDRIFLICFTLFTISLITGFMATVLIQADVKL